MNGTPGNEKFNKLLQPAFVLAFGLIIGIIAGVLIEEARDYLHKQPDFYIETGIPSQKIGAGMNGTLDLYIHNLGEYNFPITLIAYEIGFDGKPHLPAEAEEGIKIEPAANNIIWINGNDIVNAHMKLRTGINATGCHLIESKAIGGDGKERISHQVLYIE